MTKPNVRKQSEHASHPGPNPECQNPRNPHQKRSNQPTTNEMEEPKPLCASP